MKNESLSLCRFFKPGLPLKISSYPNYSRFQVGTDPIHLRKIRPPPGGIYSCQRRIPQNEFNAIRISSSMVHTMYHIIYLSYSMVVLYVYRNFRLHYRRSIEVQFLSHFFQGFLKQFYFPQTRFQKFVFVKNLSSPAIELLACVVESCLHATTTYFPAKSLCLKELSRETRGPGSNRIFNFGLNDMCR